MASWHRKIESAPLSLFFFARSLAFFIANQVCNGCEKLNFGAPSPDENATFLHCCLAGSPWIKIVKREFTATAEKVFLSLLSPLLFCIALIARENDTFFHFELSAFTSRRRALHGEATPALPNFFPSKVAGTSVGLHFSVHCLNKKAVCDHM